MKIKKRLFLAILLFLAGCDNYTLNTQAQNTSTATQCENNLPCLYSNGIKVWLSDTQLSPETPFTIHAIIPEDLTIHNAKLEGVTMYMGYIPQQFKKQDGHWQSKTMVGVCAEKTMLWKLVLVTQHTHTSVKNTQYYYFNTTY